MNEPNESETEISVPEAPTPETPVFQGPEPQEPRSTPDAAATAEPASVELPSEEPPPEEPPIVRHDPFAYMRDAPWMNRKLSPLGRAAAFLRRELKAFPAIEGREPNRADLDGIVKRTADYMVPIFKREQATDIAYDVLEEKRQARILKRQMETKTANPPEPRFTKVSGDNLDVHPDGGSISPDDGRHMESGPLLAQLDPQTLDERIRSQKWNVPSGDRDYLKSLEEFRGHEVRLPDGSRVPDSYSPTGYLMSPVEDLNAVAMAGRMAGKTRGPASFHGQLRAAIAQGGEFDYQRKAAVGGKDGFVQLRQFWNVSNFNVGLFMQQAGFPLGEVLGMAGLYAWRNSSNYRADEPYGLHPRTREFIERGYRAGASGVFD